MLNVLAVDDETSMLSALQRELNNDSINLSLMCDPLAALDRVSQEEFDIVIADYRMPLVSGVQLLKEVRQYFPRTVRMIISGHTDMDALTAMINEAMIYRYISKPWNAHQLRTVINEAGELRRELQLEADALNKLRTEQDSNYRRTKMIEELESIEPGITEVHWGPENTVILDDTPHPSRPARR
jgi:two-component system, probable response regulator PhcQ